MDATTVAIDLAKDVFELAFADTQGQIIERKRLSRNVLSRCLVNQPPLRVVMEACGSAHHWARGFQSQGHIVCLLSARDVRPYVRGNKTDRADAAGILEADRCGQIASLAIKIPEQQGVQAQHRIRERLKAQRTSLLNLLRGVMSVPHLCRADRIFNPAFQRKATRKLQNDHDHGIGHGPEAGKADNNSDFRGRLNDRLRFATFMMARARCAHRKAG